MSYEVFISHSSKDKAVADTVCTFVEERGIKCWIAPRDITPGKDWSEAIVEGIAASKVLVFLFSAVSNDSIQVRREVQRASERGLHVVPMRLEDVMPSGALEYYISGIHWMNATNGVTDAVLQDLYNRIVPSLPSQQKPPEPPPAPEPEPVIATGTSEVINHNLPFSATSFVGRERELQEIHELLSTARLLTLVGLGGCGKTRLMLKSATTMLDQFSDGVRLIELAPIEDENLVAQSVASVCGVRESPGEPILQTLLMALASRKLLLVLDNCEHLLSATAQVADKIIRSCVNVRILATSREALNIAGERVYRVPPLTLPNRLSRQTPESLANFASVQLFIERALTVQPNFTVTEENAPALASICARLDGIPLAIELAAARTKSLAVEEIDKRLDHCFRLLTGGSRTAMPRQQTLKSLFDWSYDLLQPEEKTLLHRLTLYGGGWTLEAAEDVSSGGEVEDWEVLDLLTGLVDKSMVIAETVASTTRYHMLETVRQYGREKLIETGEETIAINKYRDWFLAFAEQAEKNLQSGQQAEWLDRLEIEHDNLRVAIARCDDTPDGVRTRLRLCGALWLFWASHGHLTQGRGYLSEALAKPGVDSFPAERAKCLNAVGMLAWNQGDYASARASLEQALEINREISDLAGEAMNLDGLGLVARNQGDLAAGRTYQIQALEINRQIKNRTGEASNLGNIGLIDWNKSDFVSARSYMEQARAINRELGDRAGEASNLNGLGLVARNQGDYAASNAYFSEALAINNDIGNKDRAAANLNGLGLIHFDQGEYAEARTQIEDSLAINKEIGNRMGEAINLYWLGQIARHQEAAEQARYCMDEALKINREIGSRMGEANNLSGLALVEVDGGNHDTARQYLHQAIHIWLHLGQNHALAETLEAFAMLEMACEKHERAVRLYAAAHKLRDNIGAPVPRHLHDKHQQHKEQLKEVMGETEFNRAYEEGKGMTESAAAYALDAGN